MVEPSTRPHQPFWHAPCPHCGAEIGDACCTDDGYPRAIPCVARMKTDRDETRDETARPTKDTTPTPKVAQRSTQTSVIGIEE